MCPRSWRSVDHVIPQVGQGFGLVATELLATGNPAHEVAHYLGHASPSVTLAVYSHVTVRGRDRAAGVFDLALGSGHLEVRV